MYKVTNKAKDVRKFRDGFLGKDIFVEPGKSVFTEKPIEKSEIWNVEIVEKLEEKKQINKKEVIKDDSSSSR